MVHMKNICLTQLISFNSSVLGFTMEGGYFLPEGEAHVPM